jgi:hypothetical protein
MERAVDAEVAIRWFFRGLMERLESAQFVLGRNEFLSKQIFCHAPPFLGT